jgi:hypothetical protein
MVDSKCCGRSSRFITPEHVLRLMPDRNHRLLAFGGFPPAVRPSAFVPASMKPLQPAGLVHSALA